MKVTSLTIKNIGLIESEVIPLDKPLILFYGDIRQGKSTILNAVRYVFGGAFPSDIVRHGAAEGAIQLDFSTGHVRREFYRGADGEVKSRPLTLFLDGKKVERPVEALKRFLNPFLLDQDHLVRMTELERKRYFAELFNVDTSSIDREHAKCEEEARELRAAIRAVGDLDLTPVQPVDTSALREQSAALRRAHAESVKQAVARNAASEAHNANCKEAYATRNEWISSICEIETRIAELHRRKVEAEAEVAKLDSWIQANPVKPIEEYPPAPDTSAIESALAEASAQNVRSEQYQRNLMKDAARQRDQQRVRELEERQRQLKALKLAKLKEVSESSGVPGLSFDEEGQFVFEGTQAGMLSTSQLMKLSAQLSDLYPEGLGLDLIDRGESLGRSIFEFVDRAKKEDKTILAAIVGERPAAVPENVGVFVVSNGKLS